VQRVGVEMLNERALVYELCGGTEEEVRVVEGK
jgi:hypothetical protein